MGWKQVVQLGSVWSDREGLTFEELRDQTVAVFKEHPWHEQSEELRDVIDELSTAANVPEFDGVWDRMYDLADRDRVWIDLWNLS